MKTADLKTLIVELAAYEQELHEKVQQKETELDALLRRVLMDAKPPGTPFSVPQLRVSRPCEIPPVTQPNDEYAAVEIDDVSSIAHDSVVSADSPDISSRPPRRVRFSSRSPQVALSADASPQALTAAGDQRGIGPIAVIAEIGGIGHRDGERNGRGRTGDGALFLRRDRRQLGTGDLSQEAVLPRDSVGPQQQEQGREHSEQSLLLLRSSLNAKRPRAPHSRSVSAAREHMTQQKGRGAGIVLACGPTVFLD